MFKHNKEAGVGLFYYKTPRCCTKVNALVKPVVVGLAPTVIMAPTFSQAMVSPSDEIHCFSILIRVIPSLCIIKSSYSVLYSVQIKSELLTVLSDVWL